MTKRLLSHKQQLAEARIEERASAAPTGARGELARRTGEATQAFFADAKLEVVEHAGLEEAATLIAEFASGQVDPRLGHILLIAQ